MIPSWLWVFIIPGCINCIYGESIATTDALECDPKDEYFRPGFLYTFKYNTKAISESVGTSDRQTSVKVKCNIKIQVFESCRYRLDVSECSLLDLPYPGNDTSEYVQHSNSAKFNDELSRYPVLFYMSKGKIHKVWVQKKDPIFSVNIKRGVLSAVLIPKVGSPHIMMRTDVQGICPVVYNFTKNAITMEKNISGCHFPGRQYLHLSPFSLFWNMSFIQMWWINSTAKCEFSVANGALQTSACQERHAIRLESSYATTTAVQTNVKQSLMFESLSRSNSTSFDNSDYQLTGIQFEYEILDKSNVSSEGFLNKAIKNIEDLAETTTEEVQTYTITLFDDTLSLLRGASAEDLDSFVGKLLDRKVDSDTKSVSRRNFALGALAQCNTDECVEAFVDLFEEMPDAEKPWMYWGIVMTSLAISPPSNPETIATIATACMNLKSRQGLLSSSSMIHSYWSKNKVSEKLPESLKKVIANISTAIDATDDDDDRLLYIKALKNTGEAAEQAVPDLYEKLKRHFEDGSKGPVWKIAVLEATDKLEQNEKRRLWTLAILRNSSLESEVRAVAFKMLVPGWHDSRLEDDTRDLIKGEKSGDKMFLEYLGNELEDHRKSVFWQLPFLEDRVNHFGWERDYWRLFSRDYIQPILQRLNVTTWLFGKPLNFDSTYYSKSETGDVMSWLLELFTGQVDDREGLGNSDPLRNLAALRKLVNYGRKDLDADVWLMSNKLFGDELFYMTGNDTNGSSLKTTLIQILRQFVTRPHSSTRWTTVTRFIDAFNQIPTIIGLPLNWTTNASVAIGFTYSVSQNPTSQVSANALRYRVVPSAAVTFVNRMALDVPQFTRIGVQANTTAYTSTQFNVTLETQPGEVTLQLYPPNERQEIASLFRVNHLIRGDDLENIPDWEIERVNNDWCLNSSVVWPGTVLCQKSSYANVTDKVKPWTLMAADADWTLFADNFPDKGLDELKIKLKVAEGKRKGKAIYRLIVDSVGGNEGYEVSVAHDHDWLTGEFETKVQIPHLKYFNVRAKKSVDENGTQTDMNVTVVPDMPFALSYVNQKTKERRAVVSDNRISKSPLTPVTIYQKKCNVTTPWSLYSWTHSVHKFPTTFKFDQMYSYKSDQDKGTWIHGILPDIFWEDSNKEASVHLHWDVKKSTLGPGNVTYGFCKIPKSIIEITSENVVRIAQPRSYLFSTNITKRFLPGYELKTFLNFTYEAKTANGSDGSTFIKANLTVPQLSWELQYNGSESNHYAVFEKESMVRKRNETNKVKWPGWWHTSVADSFNIQTWNITLNISTPNIKSNNKCWNVSLTYPEGNSSEIIIGNSCLNADGNGREVELYSSGHAVKFNGSIVVNSSRSSFAATTLVTDGILSHEPSTRTITYLATFTGDKYTDGNFTIDLWTTSDYHFSLNKSSKNLLDGRGSDTWLNISANSISWSPLNVDLRQIWSTRSESPYFHETMRMVHDWMNVDVEASGGNVGKGKSGLVTDAYVFHKEFKFNSKTPMFRNSTWKLESNGSFVTVREQHPNENTDDKFYILRSNKDLDNDVDFIVCHEKLCSGYQTDPEHTLLQVKLDLTNSWILKAVTSYNSTFLEKCYNKCSERIAGIIYNATYALADPNHEINKLWKPFLGGKTVVEFIEEKGDYGEEVLQKVYGSLLEALATWEPFYGPTMEVIKRTYTYVTYKSFAARYLKDSQIGWLWKHLEVGDVIEEWAEKSPELFVKFLLGIQPGSDPKSGFTVTWEHPWFTWSNFKEPPALSNSTLQRLTRFLSDSEIPKWSLSQDGDDYNRMAAIFGDDMILTFDGRTFQVPGYTHNTCSYLLAHDFARDTFSILSTAESIQIWFTESTGVLIDIKGNNKVIGDIGEAKVTVDGEVTVVESPHLRVICNVNYNACLIFLDDFMNNKTLGLLGNNNRDPSDDWKLPNGLLTKDVVELVQSFEVSSGSAVCKDRKGLEDLEKNMCKGKMKKKEEERKKCSAFANASLCEDVIPESVFEGVCSAEESCGHGCRVLFAYHLACLAKGVQVVTNGSCWRCEGDVAIGESLSRKSVNVHLLVEKHDTFDKNFLKGLEKLVEVLDKFFHDLRYNSVKVSVYTYSGSDASPPKIRINQKTAEDVVALKLLRELDLGGGEVAGDSLGALDSLLDMGIFDDQLDANVVWVFASEDHVDTKSGATVSGVLEKLQNHRYASLFSFSNYVTGSSIKKVFGVRGDGYAFPQPKRGPDVFVEYPKGNVAKVTSALKGSVFVASVLEDLTTLPKFVTAVALEVATKVNKEHSTKVCKCQASVGLHPKLHCEGD